MTTTDQVVGKICVFYASTEAVIKGMPQPNALQFVGEVIRATPALPKRGDIPGLVLHVRGRSGKIAMVDAVDQHARYFNTWQEAMEEQNKELCQK